MFEEFLGVPAHPFVVHAPVVLVPLLVLTAAAYTLVPLVRPHTRWVLGLLAIGAPIAALLAKLSGDAFFARMREAGRITEGFIPTIETHRMWGNLTLTASAVLGILTLALVWFVPPGATAGGRRATWILVLKVLVLVAAAVSLFFVIRSGDTGGRAVWGEY